MAPEVPLQRVIRQPSRAGIEEWSTSPLMKDEPSKGYSKGITEKIPDGRRNERPSQTSISSEKDSGFSDAGSDDFSKVEQTDNEDRSTNRSSKSVELEWLDKTPRGTWSSFTNLTPVYILKNVIVQQPMKGTQFFQTRMAWNGSQAIDTTAGQTRVILIQPHMTASASNIWSVKRKRAKRAYLPVMKTLPRIAPHPGLGVKCERPVPVVQSGKMARPCKRLRMVTSRIEITKRIEPVLISKPHDSQRKIVELPPSPITKSQSPIPPSAKSVEMAIQPVSVTPKTVNTSVEPLLLLAHQEPSTKCPLSCSFSEAETLAKVSRRLASNLKKQRRFHNTMDVLKKSGLLGITLKTKELIGKNKAIRRNISELKEHTLLFCEAMKSNDCEIWKKLQDALNVSSCYWDATGSNAIKLNHIVSTDNLVKGSTDLGESSSLASKVNLPASPDRSQGLKVEISMKT